MIRKPVIFHGTNGSAFETFGKGLIGFVNVWTDHPGDALDMAGARALDDGSEMVIIAMPFYKGDPLAEQGYSVHPIGRGSEVAIRVQTAFTNPKRKNLARVEVYTEKQMGAYLTRYCRKGSLSSEMYRFDQFREKLAKKRNVEALASGESKN
jgi:hypothetical protein